MRRTRWPASRAAPGASAARRGRRSRSAWRTMPRPKWCCQRRLTITRAVSGLSGSATQLRQRQPAAGAARRRRLDRRPASACRRRARLREAGLHLVAAVAQLAALQQERLRRRRRRGRQAHRHRQRRRLAVVERLQLRLQLARARSGRRPVMRLGDLRRRDRPAAASVSRDQFLLAGGPLLRRRAVGGLRLGGQLRQLAPRSSFAAVRLFQRGDRVARSAASAPAYSREAASCRAALPRPRRPAGRGGTRPGRRTPAGGSSRSAGSARTCGRGSGRRPSVSPRKARPAVSVMSLSVFCRRCAWSAGVGHVRAEQVEAGGDQGVAGRRGTARRRRAARVTKRSYGLSALNDCG